MGKELKFAIGYGGREMSVPQAATLAENLGYDGFSSGAAIIGYGGGLDGLMVLAQAAAVTERVRLHPSVMLLPFTHPLVLAKQVASLDHLSKGRIFLGVGVGERNRLHQIYGFPMEERGARADEYIEILKGVWTQPTYKYEGKFWNFGEMPQESTYQKPHPPIWIGGRVGGVETGPDGERRFKSKLAAVRRAGRYGDGWLPYFTIPQDYKATMDLVKGYAKEYGREEHPFSWGLHLFMVVKDKYEDALASATQHQGFGGGNPEFSKRFDVIGTPKDCIKRLQEYVDAGVEYFAIQRPLVPDGEIREQMERIAKEIIPNFR